MRHFLGVGSQKFKAIFSTPEALKNLDLDSRIHISVIKFDHLRH